MKNIKWLFNRLKAMNISEMVWRIQQKMLQTKEKKEYYSLHLPVTEIPLSKEICGLKLFVERLPLNWMNKEYELFSQLELFGYPYEKYKNQWNAGFQTDNCWPQNILSYDINISQRVDIGDIRTNWELNRHFQFSSLAKNYYITGDTCYYRELKELFYDWNQQNLFLHGVSWTSAMEVAIRANAWMYTYCFLEKTFQKDEKNRDQELLDHLQHGILAMVHYITKHQAKHSSANNHLIVEMYAVGMAGILFGYKKWQESAISILTREITVQNYKDGVNKEMSLHYQCFVMEAYGLLMHAMKTNEILVPSIWYEYLTSMSEFTADACGIFGETIVFGDDDSGKILDLSGKKSNYYRYALGLMSCLLEKRYVATDGLAENLYWIFSQEELERMIRKPLYQPSAVKCYKEGGYTFFRSMDQRILMCIDHADLGFGKLAAHGHADALSFQMFVDGIPFLTDAGTYNYHFDPETRNAIRSSYFHNTVTVDGSNQSEILGPFLWGKRCRCELLKCADKHEKVCKAVAFYENIRHEREYLYHSDDTIVITDNMNDASNKIKRQIFLVNPACHLERINETAVVISCNGTKVFIENISGANLQFSEYWYSPEYGVRNKGTRIEFVTNLNTVKTIIKVETNG